MTAYSDEGQFSGIIIDLKQRGLRQRKRRLKIEIASSQTLLRLFGPAQCVKCERFFLELNSEELYPGSKREREIRRGMFTSSTKRRIRRFHVVEVH